MQDENKPEYDMVCFVISFGSMNYVSYKESPSISIFALLSNLGGILGLFLGNLFKNINVDLKCKFWDL